MHILLTVPHTFPKVLTKRIFLSKKKKKASLVGDLFIYSHDLNV